MDKELKDLYNKYDSDAILKNISDLVFPKDHQGVTPLRKHRAKKDIVFLEFFNAMALGCINFEKDNLLWKFIGDEYCPNINDTYLDVMSYNGYCINAINPQVVNDGSKIKFYVDNFYIGITRCKYEYMVLFCSNKKCLIYLIDLSGGWSWENDYTYFDSDGLFAIS